MITFHLTEPDAEALCLALATAHDALRAVERLLSNTAAHEAAGRIARLRDLVQAQLHDAPYDDDIAGYDMADLLNQNRSEGRAAGIAEERAQWLATMARLCEHAQRAAEFYQEVCREAQEVEFGDGYAKACADLIDEIGKAARK